MNKPTTINLVLIVVGVLAWTPVIVSMIQGANLRPMLDTEPVASQALNAVRP